MTQIVHAASESGLLQKHRLAQVENELQQHLYALVETGRGLTLVEENAEGYETAAALIDSIRTEELWRSSGRASFWDYLLNRWPTIAKFVENRASQRARASQMRVAAEVMENLRVSIEESGVPLRLPAKESQARALADAPPEAQMEIWTEVVQEAEETGAKTTAKAITKKKEEYLRRQDPALRTSATKFDMSDKPAGKPSRSFAYTQNEEADDTRQAVRLDVYLPADPSRGFHKPRKVAGGLTLSYAKLEQMGFYRRDPVYRQEGQVMKAVARLLRLEAGSQEFEEAVALLREQYEALLLATKDKNQTLDMELSEPNPFE